MAGEVTQNLPNSEDLHDDDATSSHLSAEHVPVPGTPQAESETKPTASATLTLEGVTAAIFPVLQEMALLKDQLVEMKDKIFMLEEEKAKLQSQQQETVRQAMESNRHRLTEQQVNLNMLSTVTQCSLSSSCST